MALVIPGLAYRMMTEISPRLAMKGAYLCAYKGMRAVWSYKRRLKKNELYPPFMFIALTNKCNLRCHGCWVEKEGTGYYLPEEQLDTVITEGKKRHAHYYTLLGGEPMMYPKLWNIFQKHRDCYFQIITNGMMFTERNAERIRQLGNITPLISIDGMQATNDKLRPLRSGKGSFERVEQGVAALMAVQGRRYRVSARVTATPFNLDLVQTLSGLVDMGFDGVMFSPMLSAPSGKAQMEAEDLDRLLDELKRCGEIVVARLRHGEVLPFTNLIKTLQRIHAYERDAYPCGAGGGYMGVSADGGLFACHRFVDDEDGRMGDITGGIDDKKRVLWLNSRHLVNQSPCGSCWARYLCAGSCHYEAIKRGRPACDYIRGWLHYCLGVYADLRKSPQKLQALLSA